MHHISKEHKYIKVHEDKYVAYIPTLAVHPYIGVAREAREPGPPNF